MDWHTELAKKIRRLSDHEEDEPGDLDRIILSLPHVAVWWCEGRDAGVMIAGRYARIVIGLEWEEPEASERLWHELAHVLIIQAGAGNGLPAAGTGYYRTRRLWSAKEEADCERVVRCLRLPQALCEEVDDDQELQRVTGFSLEMIRQCRLDHACA